MTPIEEEDLVFTFPSEWRAEKLDRKGVTQPSGLMLVDFVLDLGDRLVLLEIKDPSNPRATEASRNGFVDAMRSKGLVNDTLTPKARDSYCFLHLMARDDRPLHLIVAVGTERLSMQTLLLTQLADRLRQRLRKEADAPWSRQYIEQCDVIDINELSRLLPGVTLHRKSSAASTPAREIP